MRSKERYLTEALRLFAERGFDGVSVTDIAEAVGVSAPALYKHYPGKQALLDAVMELSARNFQEQTAKMKVDFRIHPDKRKAFVSMTESGQTRIIQDLFLRTYEEEVTTLLRRLMTVEQFRHPELAARLNRRYVDSQIDAFEQLMQEFMDTGMYRKGNARLMAVQFAAPVIMCFDVCDREPDRKDEMLKLLADHVHQFNAVYRV